MVGERLGQLLAFVAEKGRKAIIMSWCVSRGCALGFARVVSETSSGSSPQNLAADWLADGRITDNRNTLLQCAK